MNGIATSEVLFNDTGIDTNNTIDTPSQNHRPDSLVAHITQQDQPPSTFDLPTTVTDLSKSDILAPSASVESPPITPAALPEVAPLPTNAEISHLREEPRPVTLEETVEIKEDKQLKDLANDQELAEGLASGDAPIERTMATEDTPQVAFEDKMNVSDEIGAPPTTTTTADLSLPPSDMTGALPTASEALPLPLSDATGALPPVQTADLPHHPAVALLEDSHIEAPIDPTPTPAVADKDQLQADQPMQDAPLLPGKVSREREEDEAEDERATKRAKTDEDESGTSEFRVPEDAPLSPGKASREREEDDPEDEPATKRAKTGENGLATNEFKVPELPHTAQSPVIENGAVADSPQADLTGPLTQAQQKFFVKGISGLKRSSHATFFKDPVDPVKLGIPNYPNVVKNPMDLSTMEKKLKANQYSSVNDVVNDFEAIINNSVIFNGPDHAVSQEGFKLKASFDKQMARLPTADQIEPTPEEKKAQKAAVAATKPISARRESRSAASTARSPTGIASSPTTFALKPDGVPLIRRDSTAMDGRPKREIHPPKHRDPAYGSAKPKKKKFLWELKFCQEVLDELHKGKHSQYASPFYVPVDPVALNIPSYHSIVKKPMDLQTIGLKLSRGEYENAKEMENDVRQIFKNCYKFNVKGDPTYRAGEALENVFNAKWAEKQQWIESHDPASGHQTPGSDSEDEYGEEEEESDDEDDKKLSALQKQIAEMSKQVEVLSKKTKPSPPAASKKTSKSKNIKKESRKSSMVAAPPKKEKKSAAKSAKAEKPRFVTYKEKQYISEGIGSLPDSRMSDALKIIQSNVPHLKVYIATHSSNHLRMMLTV